MLSIKDYNVGMNILVNDKMQKNYSYILSKPMGIDADDFNNFGFSPELTPLEMLKMGVFEGKYINDCINEFPKEWFEESKDKRSEKSNENLNYFKIKSRQSLYVWKNKGWIIGDDPRGWFQWYCRYWLGRRTDYDEKQIKRWKSYVRHKGQILKNCKSGDLSCRPKQRQSLLQWAYDPFI